MNYAKIDKQLPFSVQRGFLLLFIEHLAFIIFMDFLNISNFADSCKNRPCTKLLNQEYNATKVATIFMVRYVYDFSHKTPTSL